MIKRPALALLLLVATAAAAPPVKIESAQIRALGISVVALQRATTGPGAARAGVATVLDSTPLLQLIDDKAAADALAAASAADAARQAALFRDHQDVSQRAVEVARAHAGADAARARTAASRFVVEWSPGLAHPDAALVAGLRSGNIRLVRLESLDVALQLRPGARVRLLRSQHATPIVAKVIGPASGPSAVSSGAAWLAQTTAPTLHTGEPLAIESTTSSGDNGVLVPANAVVQHDGRNWLFVHNRDGSFKRVALPANATPVAGGFRVTSGLAVGTPVVDRGAAALLSVEAAATSSEEP